jgi:arylsulfatase
MSDKGGDEREFRTGKSARKNWYFFTENELTPSAVRSGHFKAVFNLRGDDGASIGGLAVDSNPGWKGAEKYVATVPQVFDLWQDPQERYDIFMNSYTEPHLVLVTVGDPFRELTQTYIKYSPRKIESEAYSGPITISSYERYQWIRDQLQEPGH